MGKTTKFNLSRQKNYELYFFYQEDRNMQLNYLANIKFPRSIIDSFCCCHFYIDFFDLSFGEELHYL